MRGCAPSAVTRALKEGRIALVDGKIDPNKADEQWEKSTQARGGSKSARSEPAVGQVGYAEARARREHAEALLSELEFARESGKVVDTEQVQRAVWALFRGLQEAVMRTPRRAAARLNGITEMREIEHLIAQELRKALEGYEGNARDVIPEVKRKGADS